MVVNLTDAACWGCRWLYGRSFAGGGCGVIVGSRAAGLSAAFGQVSFGGVPETFEGSEGSFEDAVGAAAVVAGYKLAVGFVAA